MKKLDSLVFVADLHCGSKSGLMPRSYFLNDGGNEVRANPLQSWLYDCWLHGIDTLKDWTRGRNAGLVIVGDAIEGVHHRTTEIVSSDKIDHAGIAIECLAPLANLFRKCWMVEGTECHTESAESSIGRAIGAEPYRKPDASKKDFGAYAWPELPLTVQGCYGIARHHISTSMRPWTEASGIGLQMNAEICEAARVGAKIPRWMAYAHRHREGYFSDGDSLAFVCNPWQALTRHGRKVVGSARYIKPGFTMLDFSDMADGLPTIRRIKYAPRSEKTICA